MILTKLWAALLACLATACLAGMFLLSLRSSTGFSEADKKVIRAVTEAGVAAIAADIQSSPVSMGPSLLTDTRLRDALDAAVDERRRTEVDVQSVVAEVANEGLLREYPSMSVAIVDKDANVLARTGLEEALFDALVTSESFRSAQDDPKDSLFSATLGERLHTVKVSRRDLTTLERRVVAIQAVDLGGGSSLRRVLGTSYPAGLVRGKELLGEPIGGAKTEELRAIVADNLGNVPPDGASQVFVVGQGADARIGAIGRVPGPAGRGENATVLAIMSMSTAGASQHDLAQSLRQAQEDGLLAQLNWLALGALLFVALALCMYFPHLENTVPLRRLVQEFDNIGQGRQAQLYQETYNGMFGELARAAVRTHTAIREGTTEAEFGGEYDDELGEFGPASSVPAPTRRAPSRSHTTAEPPRHEAARHDGIDLPTAPAGDDVLETNALDDRDAIPPPSSHPSSRDEAPVLTEMNAEDELLSDLGTSGGASSSEPTHQEPELESFLSGSLANEPATGRTPAAHPPAHAKMARTSGASGLRPVGGGGLSRFQPPAGAPPPAAGPAPQPATPQPANDRSAYYRDVYDQFVKTKSACGENLDGFTFERFAKKLEQNATTLRKGNANADVQFTVYIKNGVAALKAKVVKS